MRDQKERFATFPFPAICVSQSSVKVTENHPKKLQATSNPTPTSEIQSKWRMKSTFLPLRKVLKGFKRLSYMFQSYKGDDEDEIEMVIGLPTDVQHVTHIGWDGFNNSWDKGQGLLSPHTISLEQFELAMAASQANESFCV